ncbi:MAG: hypothetical protein A3F33_02710 [Candidatus Woykebacteria bacterium RIFCSPHIGHO2_12_FULL_43_10]|uniref:Uncharacterized protein n=2 Tax=Candidatus Woykeibacteriota TaxID=1817899 RepID=A0A1G1WWQ5_9BACT|nr:MAG: hypothetical protein A2802_01375 [Candidatus Woykebacteria bacterium RIFCSPHIGHO2_01_FULL_43_29]OGY28579.1 MAG: hypothetical protein A3J50_04090 [Candidatus Woykebacteria bacterium RIFCSPHIGHO2_02_FULL_43_16b]OGY28781.1 MAG: hypothetical protein A3F33_02710 [Candidatus Woykebacteria bacterium RIFCSPHIGHO2_12_FULL_43_10]OGY32196.1 MAG: hypothetical protein A3A61_01645 [Candidatus Woykebacteria bacterium RIFCSPLOWO2_01_FULL_43_14]
MPLSLYDSDWEGSPEEFTYLLSKGQETAKRVPHPGPTRVGQEKGEKQIPSSAAPQEGTAGKNLSPPSR